VSSNSPHVEPRGLEPQVGEVVRAGPGPKGGLMKHEELSSSWNTVLSPFPSRSCCFDRWSLAGNVKKSICYSSA
jgi:hypothetical protein